MNGDDQLETLFEDAIKTFPKIQKHTHVLLSIMLTQKANGVILIKNSIVFNEVKSFAHSRRTNWPEKISAPVVSSIIKYRNGRSALNSESAPILLSMVGSLFASAYDVLPFSFITMPVLQTTSN